MPATRTKAHWSVDGREVQVSSLDKPYWPGNGPTKGDLLAYYRDVAPVMLPYLVGRPLTFQVFPRGLNEYAYYLRDLPARAPDWLQFVDYQPETQAEVIQVPLVEDAAGLIWYANRGAIEVHTWLSRMPHIDQPDWAVLDMDPGEAAPFERVLEAAGRVHDALERVGIRGYPKTSGGSGMHVYVPLRAGHTFDEVRDWVRQFATQLAKEHQDLIAVASGKTHAGRLVTIDHAQNSVARNTAAPYTVRGRPKAPVSTPLSWDEVRRGRFQPEDFTLRTFSKRLQQGADPWRSMFEDRQRLPERPG